MDNLIKSFERIRRQIKAYLYVLGMINWDSATEAPKGCFEYRGKQVGVISELLHQTLTSKEYIDCVNSLYKRIEDLEPIFAHEIFETKKKLDKILKIPAYEYVDYYILLSSSQEEWIKAKNNNDFGDFIPTLEKIVEYKRRFAKYLETDNLKDYDVLLDDYEPGFTTKEYDEFFYLLKQELLPLFKQVSKTKLEFDSSFNNLVYSHQKQKEFCEYLQDVFCFDKNRGLMKESEHPFTTSFSTNDVRFTVKYHEDDFTSSIFSAIHELGHAIYAQQINPKLDDTFSGEGASIGFHESQSRLFENMIGRSKIFWETHFPKLQELFPDQLRDVTVLDYYKLINKSKPSLIRIEADELSYPFHIMLRYDIEKGLINGDYEVKDLEKIWNESFEKYFGIKVDNPSLGVLQDMHWSSGMFGYFPTYALGSAYAAQIYKYMEKELDIKRILSSGKNLEINNWLKEKIHKYGSTIYPKELITLITNEDFNPRYYINYLKDKYIDLYGLK
ncbi:MAG TPA: carboxypeptidase M32 [Acholeplasmataceae bacterium]|nr:carboxypeptidase M32 [Acholeplasmataceae bacterium]